MITVRFPSGLSVTYNDANYLTHSSTAHQLWQRKNAAGQGEGFIASIQSSAGAIVEYVKPCRVERVAENLTPETALVLLVQHIRDIRPTNRCSGVATNLRSLKGILKQFNSTRATWK